MDDLTPETLENAYRNSAASGDDFTCNLIDALRAEKAAREEVERENADLLSPERDATGLTYGDRRAWDDLCQRWKEAEARAVKAEQERDDWKAQAESYDADARAEFVKREAAESAYAALVARCKELARQMDGIPGERRASRALRALAEKEQDQ